jgi:hypothetical protein
MNRKLRAALPFALLIAQSVSAGTLPESEDVITDTLEIAELSQSGLAAKKARRKKRWPSSQSVYNVRHGSRKIRAQAWPVRNQKRRSDGSGW